MRILFPIRKQMMMQTNQQQQGQRYRALGQQSLGGVLASGSSLINETIMEEGEEPKTQGKRQTTSRNIKNH